MSSSPRLLLAWLALAPLLSSCWLGSDVIRDKVDAFQAADTEIVIDTDALDDTDVIDDTEDTEVNEDTEIPVDTEIPGDTDLPLACADEVLVSLLGTTETSGDTRTTSDDYQGSCSDLPGGGDHSIAWQADHDSCYIFTLIDSTFDTVLYLFDECEGTELACNDDYFKEADGYASEIQRHVSTGEEMLIVVDSWAGSDEGSWILSILDGEALPIDAVLPSIEGTLITDHNGFADDTMEHGICGGESAADMLYSWTAPSPGRWRFTNVGTDFDAVLTLHRSCEAYTIACDDAGDPGAESLEMTLDQGETIILRLAGYQWAFDDIETGNFSLQATLLP
jgi:hypothetical protein